MWRYPKPINDRISNSPGFSTRSQSLYPQPPPTPHTPTPPPYLPLFLYLHLLPLSLPPFPYSLPYTFLLSPIPSFFPLPSSLRQLHIPFLLFPLWLFSAAVFPVSGAAPWMGWLMRANPMYYGVSLMRSAFNGGEMEPSVWVGWSIPLLADRKSTRLNSSHW